MHNRRRGRPLTLHSITIYPVKSLDPVELDATTVTPGGTLDYDRRWALRGSDGRFVNGKATPAIHFLHAKFYLPLQLVTLSWQKEPDEYTFSLTREAAEAGDWISRKLGVAVTLVTDPERGFPDDLDAYGPTVISRGTLQTVASWFAGMDEEDVRRRFRPNLVIDGVPPFWEDGLYRAQGTVLFRIGDVAIHGVNPCARCVVPTRDPENGTPWPRFRSVFLAKRKATLPAWAERSRFDHYYRLAVNTRVPLSEAGKQLRVGDPVACVDEAGSTVSPEATQAPTRISR